jgi:hypothetical protein
MPRLDVEILFGHNLHVFTNILDITTQQSPETPPAPNPATYPNPAASNMLGF